MCLNSHTEEQSSLKLTQLFTRRDDLDTPTRVKIAVIAKYFNRHGTVTKLAKRYAISRSFVYILTGQLSQMVDTWFEKSEVPNEYLNQLAKAENLRRLLRYRLIGTCSISKCSTLLKTDKVKNTSFGWCSEQLQLAGDKLSNMVDWEGKAVYASDEIYYAQNKPILVTVDPISGAILRIDKEPSLTKAGWERHWTSLQQQGIEPILLVRDEGRALIAAQKTVLNQVPFQPDTFHAVTHKLYHIEQTLQRKAFQAMEKEYYSQGVFQRAVTPSNIINKGNKYEKAKLKTIEALGVLEDFQWLYHQLRRQLKVTRADGTLRNRKFAEQEVLTALELMQLLPIDATKVIGHIKLLMPNLFSFLDRGIEQVKKIATTIPDYLLPFWMAYWQYHRSLINVKPTAARKRLIKRYEWMEPLLKQEYELIEKSFETHKAIVFAHLNSIIQSSSMVESANARLRPFINEMKGQISQQMLNLVMFYHNHCRFKRGKRKGFAPIELLKNEKLDKDWLELLLDIICPVPIS